MKLFKPIVLLILFLQLTNAFYAQDSISAYTKHTFMIPMRDGIKLFTMVLTPNAANQPSPFYS